MVFTQDDILLLQVVANFCKRELDGRYQCKCGGRVILQVTTDNYGIPVLTPVCEACKQVNPPATLINTENAIWEMFARQLLAMTVQLESDLHAFPDRN